MDTTPMPIATQPKPARNPAVAPHASVVFESFKNIARLKAITRLRMKLMANVFAVAAGGSLVKPLAFFHSPANRSGEYHSPPTRKAATAAARMAQKFKV